MYSNEISSRKRKSKVLVNKSKFLSHDLFLENFGEKFWIAKGHILSQICMILDEDF